MVDVSKIVKFVEDKLGAKSNHDGQIQQKNAAEYSLFMAEMGRQVREEGLGKEDFNNMLNEAFGLELSDANASRPAASRCNDGGNSGNGGVNINITINIDIDIVLNACGCGGCSGKDQDLALQQLVDMLIAEMTREGGSVENFIIGLINAFSDSSKVDFSNLEVLLNKIIEKLDAQDKKIDGLQESVDNLSSFVKEQFEILFKTLERYAKQYGLDITEIKNMLGEIDTNNKDALAKLGNIYSAIMDLTDMFNDFSKVEQQRFDEVMQAIANIKVDSGDTEGLMKKLDAMYTLLLSIQGDTSATKENSAILIDMVRQGKTEILNAIHNINIVVPPQGCSYDDTEIRKMLTQILTNMVTKGDLDTQLTKFSQIIELAINQGKTEILDAIHNINVVVTPGGGSYDDSAIRAMLQEILTNMVTRGDLDARFDAQLTQFNQMITKMTELLGRKIDTAETNIINAMKDIEANIKTAIANISVNPGNPDCSGMIALLNEIMAKLDKMDEDNAKNFSAVFQAIANIKTGEPVNLDEVLELLRKIKALAEANSGKLDGVLKNQETIALVLNGIVDGLNRLEGKVDGIRDVVDRIKEIVEKLHNCECECLSEDKLREILCEFIEKVNEGVKEGQDIADQLGARQFVSNLEEQLGLSNDTSGIQAVQTDTRQQKGVYDLNGRRVADSPEGLKPGIYIIDGKKTVIK